MNSNNYENDEEVFENFSGKEILYAKLGPSNHELSLVFSDKTVLCFYHKPDCCESVTIEDIVGDLQDLSKTKISKIALSSSALEQDSQSYDESSTWTFLKIASEKGYVTVRWFGFSNGYYSETPACETFNLDDTTEPYNNTLRSVRDHLRNN